MSLYEPFLHALNETGVRYVVVGGLATVLHGYARLTADIDIILELEPDSTREAMQSLSALGLRPRAPVQAIDFADAGQRRRWIEDKGMRVFSLWHPADPLLEVDLFVDHPIPFQDLWDRSQVVHLGAIDLRIASIEDLIRLKRLASRPEDLQDIEALEAILAERGRDDG